MLRDDKGPERGAERIGFADQLAKAIAAEVGILRGVGDESLLGQFACEAMIVRTVKLGISHVTGEAVETVLAYDNGPAFARLDSLGDQQNAGRDHVRPDVHGDLIADVGWLIVNLRRADIGRKHRLIKLPDDVALKCFAIGFGGLFPFFR